MSTPALTGQAVNAGRFEYTLESALGEDEIFATSDLTLNAFDRILQVLEIADERF